MNVIFSISLLLLSCLASVSLGGFIKSKEAWGYANVRENAHMFWWLYYTDQVKDYASFPLVIWIQGGPGSSATAYGNFMEIGPLDKNLKPRNTTWLKKANLLFLDNPVGTGFSYVTDQSALARNNSQIGKDLVSALKSILGRLPEFQKSPLYIFGESYGGKMTVDFALALTKAIKEGSITCNFKGISLGDSFVSPIDSISTWGSYLYTLSLLDKRELDVVNEYARKINASVVANQYEKAVDEMMAMQNTVANFTNEVDWFNVLKRESPLSYGPVREFNKEYNQYAFASQTEIHHSDPLSGFMNGKIRQKLKDIPKNITWGGQVSDVFPALKQDFIKGVLPLVDRLLTNESQIEVNIYNGQLDLTVPTIGTLQWIEKLKWSGLKGFSEASKKPFDFSGTHTKGFVKSFQQLKFFWIMNAGHVVPEDAPETILRMLDYVIGNKK